MKKLFLILILFVTVASNSFAQTNQSPKTYPVRDTIRIPIFDKTTNKTQIVEICSYDAGSVAVGTEVFAKCTKDEIVNAVVFLQIKKVVGGTKKPGEIHTQIQRHDVVYRPVVEEDGYFQDGVEGVVTAAGAKIGGYITNVSDQRLCKFTLTIVGSKDNYAPCVKLDEKKETKSISEFVLRGFATNSDSSLTINVDMFKKYDHPDNIKVLDDFVTVGEAN